nr:hypothetical protein CFP56_38966 [Quercus suber]
MKWRVRSITETKKSQKLTHAIIAGIPDTLSCSVVLLFALGAWEPCNAPLVSRTVLWHINKTRSPSILQLALMISTAFVCDLAILYSVYYTPSLGPTYSLHHGTSYSGLEPLMEIYRGKGRFDRPQNQHKHSIYSSVSLPMLRFAGLQFRTTAASASGATANSQESVCSLRLYSAQDCLSRGFG